MKKITLRQFWEAIDNPAERLYHDEDADEILYHCSPLEDSALMEEILAGDVRVQLYILTELAAVANARRKDPEIAYGIGFHTICRNPSECEKYEKVMEGIFKQVYFLRDERTHERAAVSVMHAHPQTLAAFEKIRNEGRVDKIVLHFLPEESVTPQYGEPAAYIMERRESADDKYIGEMRESTFFKMIEEDVSFNGIAYFWTAGFSAEELEADPYIQALLALGLQVTVLGYHDDDVTTIAVSR